jgi:DNA-binding CsgD family transcriptional regulator
MNQDTLLPKRDQMADNREKHIWRLIAIGGFTFCLFTVIIDFIIPPPSILQAKDLINFRLIVAMNVCAMIGFLYLVFFPMRFPVFVCFSFVYALIITVDGGSIIGFLMFMLYIAFALRSGFLARRAKAKLIGSILIYVAAFVSQIRYGPELMLHNFLEITAMTGIIALGAYSCLDKLGSACARMTNNGPDKKASPTESDPRGFDDRRFSSRDRDFLNRVLAGEKYLKIAIDYSLSESTVKHRMLVLFEKLGVRDRDEFVKKFQNAITAAPSVLARD